MKRLHWLELFRPDPQNVRHQRYCSKPTCHKAGNVAGWASRRPGMILKARQMSGGYRRGGRPIYATGAERELQRPLRYKNTHRNSCIPAGKSVFTDSN